MISTKTAFSLEKYLKEGQKVIDEGLERFIPPAEGVFKTIHESMRYSIFAGGKRLRPILALASFSVFSKDNPLSKRELEKILPSACALEMIHTYSLIHDDLPAMDNDDFRRGKPTNHKVFGEAVAVLAGDALLTLAFECVSKTPETGPDVVLNAIRELAETGGTSGLIGGQVLDLEGEGKKLSGEDLQRIHLRKTAALIKTSVVLGAIVGEAPEKDRKQLSAFGNKIGLAFQIVDDVLDVESSSEVLGKTAGKDADQNKATYPALYGLEKAKKMASVLKEEAIELMRPYKEKGESLSSLASFVIDRKN